MELDPVASVRVDLAIIAARPVHDRAEIPADPRLGRPPRSPILDALADRRALNAVHVINKDARQLLERFGRRGQVALVPQREAEVFLVHPSYCMAIYLEEIPGAKVEDRPFPAKYLFGIS